MSISDYYYDEINSAELIDDAEDDQEHPSYDEYKEERAGFNKFTDISTEHKRFADAYYDAIFTDQDHKHIQYCKNQMDHLQQLANDGQEYIVNF